MLFGELPHLDNAAVPMERPFEGTAAPQEQDPGDGFHFALYLFPELEDWLPLLRRLGLSAGDGAYLAAHASRNGTDFQTELLASGLVGEEEFCRALAEELGVGRLDRIDPERLIVSDELAVSRLRRSAWHIPVKLAGKDGATSYLIMPERLSLGHLSRLIADHPRIRRHLRLAAPGVMRAALLSRVRQLLVKQATNGLFDRHPDLSARIVANAWQGSIVGALLAALPVAFWIAPGGVWVALHLVFSSFFLACVGLRFAALASFGPRVSPKLPAVPAADLPVYSVLVALYREAEVVPELVAALQRIDWPKSKLDIKLVCEVDDDATLGAIRALSLPGNMEVVEVPVFGPRTKPKALAYALPLTSGDFVVLYDAEDHPHPKQLLHAWQKFRESPPEVACIQAPLEIANRGAGIVARMFAFEYAALFRGMLPWLSGNRMLLPLGGTSNHFRRAVLEEVGGWDPYNVTEDADLGMRLARFGYRTETIACPTWESGPDTLAIWLPQRTRWFKGWMQTWLVHMRDPSLLMRELGPGSFVIGQILFAGMVLSALAHPFLLFTGVILVVDLALARPTDSWKSALLAIDIVNVACGYLSFLLLGWQTLKLRERFGFWMIVLFTPVYWMLMSVAAWRAVWQLWRKPHLWEKTPHRPMRRVPAADPAARISARR
jgi:cellulose synthase/poly-beta-1,6-N-acetylglucosamine synthase-like glycosyltransferase